MVTLFMFSLSNFQISLFINRKSDSDVPLKYALFIRNGSDTCAVTQKERDAMTQGNFTHFLPSYHHRRRRLVAWAVSNHHPKNTRVAFFKALSRFVEVSCRFSASQLLHMHVFISMFVNTKDLPVSNYGRRNIPVVGISPVTCSS